MNKVHFTKTTVQRMTEQGLEYLDDDGGLQRIDFETCRNYDVERVNARNIERRPGHLYIDTPQTWKYVATRNVIGDPPWEVDPYENAPMLNFILSHQPGLNSRRQKTAMPSFICFTR